MLAAAAAAAVGFLRYGFHGAGARGTGWVFFAVVVSASWAIQKLLTPAARREGRRVMVYEGASQDPTTFSLDDVVAAELDAAGACIRLLRSSGECITVSTSRFSADSLQRFAALFAGLAPASPRPEPTRE